MQREHPYAAPIIAKKSFVNAERSAMLSNNPMSASISLQTPISRKIPSRTRVESPIHPSASLRPPLSAVSFVLEETKAVVWVSDWVCHLLQARRASETGIFFEKEDRLLDAYYGSFGRGLRVHDKQTLKTPAKFFTKYGSALKMLLPGSSLIRKYRKLFKSIAIPLFEKNFPQLTRSVKLRPLLKKIEKETYRNVMLVHKMADLHGSPVPDLAAFWFGVSHPVYDAMFDSIIDEGIDVSSYDLEQRLIRVTRIIMRDFELPAPILKMERILIEIVKGLEGSIPARNVESFFDALFKLNLAQIESMRQQSPDITDEELRMTTFRKGGYSIHLYVLLADYEYSDYEMETFYLGGAFLQSLDDMSDVDEDEAEGIATLVVKKLIVPAELWSMRDCFHRRIDEQVALGNYDQREVRTYFGAVDTFLIIATEKYHYAIKRFEDENLPRSAGEKIWNEIAKTIKCLFRIINFPSQKILETAFPLLKYSN